MAERLSNIHGSERDRVNCPFYFKIGSCRHGDRCSRLHHRPTLSPSLLLPNMYLNPTLNAPIGPDGLPMRVDPDQAQSHYEDFYEDIFEEMTKHGELEELNICDNLADHMVGNIYVKFVDEIAAAQAMNALQGRYYAGRPITVEFSPVTDFREATCRQYEEETCNRGGYCNFMHLKPINRELRKHLFGRFAGSAATLERERLERDRGHDRGRGGGRGFGGRGGGPRGGGDRYDRRDDRGRRRSRSPGGYRYDDRRDDRRRERSPARGRDGGESEADRRARFAEWNRQRQAAGGGGGGGPPALGPGPPQQGYPGAPPPSYH